MFNGIYSHNAITKSPLVNRNHNPLALNLLIAFTQTETNMSHGLINAFKTHSGHTILYCVFNCSVFANPWKRTI